MVPEEPGFVMNAVEYGTGQIRQFKKIEWTPQPDITAHQLAELMPLLLGMALHPLNYWEDHIPPSALRHFKISDQ